MNSNENSDKIARLRRAGRKHSYFQPLSIPGVSRHIRCSVLSLCGAIEMNSFENGAKIARLRRACKKHVTECAYVCD